MAEFVNGDYDSLLSVCISHSFIWHNEETGARPLNYDFRKRPRKQDMSSEFQENGAIYITKYQVLSGEHSRLGGKIGLYIMPEEDSLEIDSEFEFRLCEQVMKERV